MKDEWRKLADMDKPAGKCENCGHDEVKRIMVPTAFSFTDGGHKAEYSKYGPRKR
jgi:hypothetical protein